MRSSNNVTISLPKDYIQKLESLKEDGETIGLCMKRLLIGLLDGVALPEEPPHYLEDQVSKLQQQLMNLEEMITASPHKEASLTDASISTQQVDQLAQKVEELRRKTQGVESRVTSVQNITSRNAKELNELKGQMTFSPTATDNSQLENRLIQLEGKLETLEYGVEKFIESVFDIGKRLTALEDSGTPAHPTQQTEPPLSDIEKLTTQAKNDGLTCAELARLLGKHPSNVTRWKKREGRIDPSGKYQWDGIDRWFPFP